MKKFLTGILALTLVLSFTGCGGGTNSAEHGDRSNLIYEDTISPNVEYVAKESDKVFYTIQVYQEENGILVASSSNSAFSKDMSYEIETTDQIAEDDIHVQWRTLTGSASASKEDEFAVAVVTVSVKGKVISERTVSFIGNAIDTVVDAVNQK